MNYLIVIPRFVDKVGEWYFFPLGIPYVSASMKANNFRPVTLNLNNEHGSVAEILQEAICHNQIDVVLTGGLSVQYNSIKEVVHIAKKIKPDIVTIVGGGIITSTPEAGMKALGEVDFGIIGEGEITTCELCKAIEEGMNVASVAGLIYWEKQTGRYHVTEKRKEIEDIDIIPAPDYDGFKFAETIDLVPSMSAVNQSRTLVMLGSRSCPFHCTFCFHPSGVKYRQRSVDGFFDELEYLVKKYDVRHVFIADELFAYDKKRVQEFCKRIKKLNIPWYACFRVSDVTEELVEILKDGNCHTMAVGLESADNRILKSMKKHTTVEEIETALKIIYEAGITIQGNFIFGDVEETIETAKNTLKWWKDHSQYAIILNFIVTYPGTPLYEYACKSGIIKDEVQFIKDGCPAVNVSKMTSEETAWLSNQIMRSAQDIIKIPKDISNESVDESRKTISFDGVCIHCGRKNRWADIRLFLRNQLACDACGGKHRVPIIQIAEKYIEKNILQLLKKHPSIAFWGLPDYFIDLVDMLDIMSNPNIYFIDNSKLKQTWTLKGKQVYSPQIVKEKNIDLVIVGATGYFAMIADQIRADYGKVKCVNILELISRNLDVKL